MVNVPLKKHRVNYKNGLMTKIRRMQQALYKDVSLKILAKPPLIILRPHSELVYKEASQRKLVNTVRTAFADPPPT